MTATITVQADEHGMRLDRWISQHYPGLPHALVCKLARKGAIRVDGQRIKPSFRLQAHQSIQLLPSAQAQTSSHHESHHTHGWHAPERARQWIEAHTITRLTQEPHDLLYLNKPPNIPTQGGAQAPVNVDDMAKAWGAAQDPPLKPRLVHRLDRATSGVLAIALNVTTARLCARSFAQRTVHKTYHAWVHGHPAQAHGTISAPLLKTTGAQLMRVDPQGHPAVTHFTVLERTDSVCLLELTPTTGRTHQLRVHCAFINCPILGDSRYGDPERDRLGCIAPRLHLHATRLELQPFPAVEAPLGFPKGATLWRGS